MRSRLSRNVFCSSGPTAADMTVDFKDHGIAAVSIWMGTILTQRVRDIVAANPDGLGRVLDSADRVDRPRHMGAVPGPALMELSGQTLIGAELAVRYGIRDEGDRQPPSCRASGVYPQPQFGRAPGQLTS